MRSAAVLVGDEPVHGVSVARPAAERECGTDRYAGKDERRDDGDTHRLTVAERSTRG
jgi:hypothetical protein